MVGLSVLLKVRRCSRPNHTPGFHPRRQLHRAASRQGTCPPFPSEPQPHIQEADNIKASLETFYGVGPSISQRVMARFHIHPTAKVGSLANSEIQALTSELSNMTIETDLRRKMRENIRRLRDMGSYRGRRHAMGLPVRGQNTRTQVRRSRQRRSQHCPEPQGKRT